MKTRTCVWNLRSWTSWARLIGRREASAVADTALLAGPLLCPEPTTPTRSCPLVNSRSDPAFTPERELSSELHYSGVSRRGLFSKAIRLGLYTCILYVCIYIYTYIYGFLVCRYARSLVLAARQNTPAIDGAIYRPNGTSYQLQPSFHLH